MAICCISSKFGGLTATALAISYTAYLSHQIKRSRLRYWIGTAGKWLLERRLSPRRRACVPFLVATETFPKSHVPRFKSTQRAALRPKRGDSSEALAPPSVLFSLELLVVQQVQARTHGKTHPGNSPRTCLISFVIERCSRHLLSEVSVPL